MGDDAAEHPGARRNRRVRVALMDDYEVIVLGLQQLLAPYSHRIQVVEAVSLLPIESDVDVLLYDGYSNERVIGPAEEALRATQARFVLYSWRLAPKIVEEAMEKGAAGCLSKSLSAEQLVAAIERIAAGERVISRDPGPSAPMNQPDWPGRVHGLTARESEILALIAQGLTNQEIAERAFLSINTVKTFIRSAYRKIGVQRRTQALLWAARHGFVPHPARTIFVEAATPVHASADET